MAGKRDTIRSEMDNEKKMQAGMQESNESMAQALREVEAEIEAIEKLQAPAVVEDPELSHTTLKDL